MEYKIEAPFDRIAGGEHGHLNCLGPKWLESFVVQMDALPTNGMGKSVRLVLTGVNIVILREWSVVLTYLDKVMSRGYRYIYCDLAGDMHGYIATPQETVQYKKGLYQKRQLTKEQNEFSLNAHRIRSFLESLQTSSVLNRGGRTGRFSYPFLSGDGKEFDHYSGEQGKPTVELPYSVIASKADCRRFLDSKEIRVWRDRMQTRFHASPLFENDELWRVFCHELSVNIWEHAKASGFISARIVEPFENGKLKSWCACSYAHLDTALMNQLSEGFVELCVSDSGQGFLTTLRQAYATATGDTDETEDENVLAFAFDIHGTSKSKEQRWTTERHALGRILQLVSKYGGQLTLRSGRGEVLYASNGVTFERLPDRRGRRPTVSRRIPFLEGAHFQLILPLVPLMPKAVACRSRLYAALPAAYRIQPQHVQGHLVPLRELLDFPQACIDSEDRIQFRDRTERLCKTLLTRRPNSEPLVLDFSELDWTAGQFETFLYLMQHALNDRPALLVEIKPALAEEVIELTTRKKSDTNEREPTQLHPEVANTSSGAAGNSFDELPETYFMQAYHGIHSTLLGVDRKGTLHVFGAEDELIASALLSLINTPERIDVLSRRHQIPERKLRAILTHVNPLFESSGDVCATIWDSKAIEIESSRAISNHFDKIIERCRAWRGRFIPDGKGDPDIAPDTGREVFNLSWESKDLWVKEFFESSRILFRERYIDEYAQRLNFRLRSGLERIEKSLGDVAVLAAVSAPSLLLATALHRWWPGDDRPAVADLGFYRMLQPDGELPIVAEEGGIVVVQDVIYTGDRSRDLVRHLTSQGKAVLCVLSLVEMDEEVTATQITGYDYGWDETPVPIHAMVKLAAPRIVAPQDIVSDEDTYWIEPRSLRPFRYSTLRQGRHSRGDDEHARPDALQFIRPVFSTGHFVYGHMHYDIIVDIPRTINGDIGGQAASWICDLCEGRSPRERAAWETNSGYKLEGEATVVLMPLHSQMYHIVPRIEEILAMRGRRQPMWFSDATLFLGVGQVYRIPIHFEHQIHVALADAKNARESGLKRIEHPLRILILEDTVSDGHEIETIINDLVRAIDKGVRKCGGDFADAQMAVSWIRLFCLFNQMDRSADKRWRDQAKVGGVMNIDFVFEDMEHAVGVTSYSEWNCPICFEIGRLRRIRDASESSFVASLQAWAADREIQLEPQAIDSRQARSHTRRPLPVPLSVRRPNRGIAQGRVAESFTYVDDAIREFYRLMYYSCPPGDVLEAIHDIDITSFTPEEKGEYAKFRWAVYRWCFQNWPRLGAFGMVPVFLDCITKELTLGGDLLVPAALHLSDRLADERVRGFVHNCLVLMFELERTLYQRELVEVSGTSPLKDKIISLNFALTALLIQVSVEERQNLALHDGRGEYVPLEQMLAEGVASIPPYCASVSRSIYTWISRPKASSAYPAWALRSIYEITMRGYDPDVPPESWDHFSLPSLLTRAIRHSADRFVRHLLQDLLPLLTAAISELYMYGHLDGAKEIEDHAKGIAHWLTSGAPDGDFEVSKPRALTHLFDCLAPTAPFGQSFNRRWHPRVDDIIADLTRRYLAYRGRNRGQLTFRGYSELKAVGVRLLTNATALVDMVHNWTIEPIKDYDGSHYSEVLVRWSESGGEVVFEIQTSYAPPSITEDRIRKGRNALSAHPLLMPFGVNLDEPWGEADKLPFLAKKRITVPVGYAGRP